MIRLNFSRDSVYNTVISSEDNEIMYEVSTPNVWSLTKSAITTIMKLDKTSEQKMFVGEIEWRGLHHRIVVRIGSQNCEWLLAKVWLTNSKGISTAKTFDAAQGVRYRWKLRKLEYHLTAPESPPEGRSPSLAIFHSPIISSLGPTYLEVSSSVLQDLDHILVALLVMEKMRRDD